MNFEVLNAVTRAPLQPASLKLLALMMAVHSNKDTGRFWPSVGRLAAECSLSVAHVKRVKAALQQLGVLRVVEASGGGKRTATTVYEFDLKRLAELAEGAHDGTGFTVEPGSPVRPYPAHLRAPTRLTGEPEPGSRVSHKGEGKRSEPEPKSRHRSASPVASGARSARGGSKTKERRIGFDRDYYLEDAK